ncbi:MAG: Unknown protein [uncultured Sulfurovum sp.]|uniref:Uncharacterized protein n=1 Tax=uncultured Sulfurovum sp. TaxID=269237 RepID=A0A6S6S996_9BACT|nr:MAG: Unknown protein [uncultured Sulfurovum sp.]
MLKYVLVFLMLGIGFLNATEVQSIEKLEAQKKALELKLEAYALKKKIIEMEIFFEKNRVEKEERMEREKALIQFKNDISANRKQGKLNNYHYKG